MKVLFLFPYPSGTAASQRFRFEQYLDFLREEGVEYTLVPFLDEATWKILYKPGNTLQKAWGIGKGFLRRLGILFTVAQYDFVFIHREATPIGPPFMEWIIARIFRKRIIFDFDDAIWLPNTSENNRIAAKLKWHQKTASICRWAWKISAGNAYLADYARQCRNAELENSLSETTKTPLFNEDGSEVGIHSEFRIPNSEIIINPTTIDTTHLHNRLKDQHTNNLVIGWTGTHSTISYLEALVPVLAKLEKDYAFTFLVISDRKPSFALQSLQYIPWNKATEADDLLRMNIGVMPLTDDPWSRGKCGFKALQYMALGIPALASPVGVNMEIIQPGVNGFLCQTPEDWENSIRQLLQTPDLRVNLGKAARQRIEERYSVQANRLTFLRFFTA
jgi:glycosyltransferase involved in cell wall biosynthesis